MSLSLLAFSFASFRSASILLIIFSISIFCTPIQATKQPPHTERKRAARPLERATLGQAAKVSTPLATVVWVDETRHVPRTSPFGGILAD
jgi:hypothetical protein